MQQEGQSILQGSKISLYIDDPVYGCFNMKQGDVVRVVHTNPNGDCIRYDLVVKEKGIQLIKSDATYQIHPIGSENNNT